MIEANQEPTLWTNLTHKYVDDTTLSELLTRGSVVSTMQTSFQQLQQWTENNMQINFSKTKEMILGPLAKLSPQPLSCNSGSHLVLYSRKGPVF